MSLALPKFELYKEGGQIRRSSKSVTTMIVEGYGRKRYKADFIKYLVYTQSDCHETLVHLNFLFAAESLKDKDCYQNLHAEYDRFRMKINKFIPKVEDNWCEFPAKETRNQ